MNLLSQAKKMPIGSGVYLFISKNKKILYVGRAVSLKRRVLNYFRKNIDLRIREMISLAHKIKYIKTDSVLEAIILEANLIKKYWPKYNVKEKDNRSFIYIAIPKSDFSRPYIIRQHELKNFPIKSEIFGPYQSEVLIRKGLRIIRKIFPYSTCRINSNKPCFDYQIGFCPGICIGRISKSDYKKNIDNLILFLKGEKKKLFKKLKIDNPLAIQSLKHIQDVALISDEKIKQNFFNRIEGYDISHLTGKEAFGSMVVLTNGILDKSQYRLFKIKKAPKNDDLRALEEVLKRRLAHKEWLMPNLIFLDGGKPQVDYISKKLKEENIAIPIIGVSKFANDKIVFQKNIKSSFKQTIQSFKKDILKLRDEAHRFAIKNSRKKRGLFR